jgi:hypothetical protein
LAAWAASLKKECWRVHCRNQRVSCRIASCLQIKMTPHTPHGKIKCLGRTCLLHFTVYVLYLKFLDVVWRRTSSTITLSHRV